MKATDENILMAIDSYTNEHGFSPSVRDLCRILGISSPGAMKYRLKKLRDGGMLDYKDKMPRTIRLTRAGGVKCR